MTRCPHIEPPRPRRACVLPAEHLGAHQYPIDLLSEPILAESLKGEAMSDRIALHWQTKAREMARLLKFVLDKGDTPIWLSDGWREDTAAVLKETL